MCRQAVNDTDVPFPFILLPVLSWRGWSPSAQIGMLSAHRMSLVVNASASVGARTQQVTDGTDRTFYWRSATAS